MEFISFQMIFLISFDRKACQFLRQDICLHVPQELSDDIISKVSFIKRINPQKLLRAANMRCVADFLVSENVLWM